jgi:hypothetical protein
MKSERLADGQFSPRSVLALGALGSARGLAIQGGPVIVENFTPEDWMDWTACCSPVAPERRGLEQMEHHSNLPADLLARPGATFAGGPDSSVPRKA